MIHKYSMNGLFIVLDVNSGAVHIVDEIVYDVLDYYKELSVEEIVSRLNNKYSEDKLKEAYNEIAELEKEKLIYTEDIYKEVVPLIEKETQLLRLSAYTLLTIVI